MMIFPVAIYAIAFMTPPFPYELLDVSGFTAGTPDNGIFRGSRKDGLHIEIEVRLLDSRRRVNGVDKRGIATNDGVSFEPSSGLRIGFGCRYSIDKARGFLQVGTPFSEVAVHFVPQAGTDAKGFFVPSNHDWADDAKLMERITRETVALGAGTRLTSFTTTTMGGATIPCASCRYSNQSFGDIKRWSQLRGWTFEENVDYGYFMMKKGSDYAVVPLGGNGIKVTGEWFDLPDVIARQDGTVYVPREAIERLSHE